MRVLGFALCAAVCAVAGTPSLAVNRCAGPNGEVVFSDKACPLAPGQRTPDPQAAKPGAKASGAITPAEAKAFADKMNAEIARGIAQREQERALQAAADAARPKPSSTSQPMSFAACRALVSRSLLSVAGATKTFAIVNTAVLTIHKICTVDGSVILTCTAEEETFITTTSPYPCP